MVGMQGGGGMEWGAFALKHIRHRCNIPGLDELTLQHNVTNDTIYATFYNGDLVHLWKKTDVVEIRRDFKPELYSQWREMIF